MHCTFYFTWSHNLPTVHLLKKHYSDLVGTIQDPAGVADSLYSRGVISRHMRDEVQQRDMTMRRKNEVLVNAVDAQVTTDPSVYQVFLEVLGEEPYLSTIVRNISKTCESGADIINCSRSRYRGGGGGGGGLGPLAFCIGPDLTNPFF